MNLAAPSCALARAVRDRVLPVLLLSARLAGGADGHEEALTWSELPPLPDPLGVAAPFAGVTGDALLVAGGANFPDGMPWDGGRKVWHDEVAVLRAPSSRWEAVGKLPRPLAYGVSITTGSGVVCVGGSDQERHYRDVFLLTFTNSVLRLHPMPSLPLELANAAGALVGSCLYVAGGSEQPGELAALNRCFLLRLSASQGSWEEVEPFPGRARILPVVAALDDDFYLMGGAALQRVDGKTSRVYLRDAWQYRPGKGWNRLADLPKPCVAGPSPAPVFKTKLLLIGGDDGSRFGFEPVANHPGFPGTILAYDSRTDCWASLGTAPFSRATVPVVRWRDRFVFTSGESRPGVRSPEIWSLQIAERP